ncbi:MAG: hypothetical protein WDO19_27950 [Bacteroidota bacterium]
MYLNAGIVKKNQNCNKKAVPTPSSTLHLYIAFVQHHDLLAQAEADAASALF